MSVGSGVWQTLSGVTCGPVVLSIVVEDPECRLLLELIDVGEMHPELVLAGSAFAIFRSWLGPGGAVSPRTIRVKNVRMERHAQYEEADQNPLTHLHPHQSHMADRSTQCVP